MISPKDATRAARDYAKDIFDGEVLQYLRVEELELSEDEKTWLVTLGWVEPGNRNVGSSGIYVRPTIEALPRVYKLFPVDAETGTVTTMKFVD